MTVLIGLVMWFGMAAVPQAADGCMGVSGQLDLPAQVKTRGKPKRIRWEDVNSMMPKLREAVKGTPCRLTFGQVFAPKREDVFFPILDSILRTAPEEELVGVAVFYLDGDQAGVFSNRVIFEKTSYKQYYFQYKAKDGELRATNRNLLDYAENKPIFLMRWQDIKDKVAVTGEQQE